MPLCSIFIWKCLVYNYSIMYDHDISAIIMSDEDVNYYS